MRVRVKRMYPDGGTLPPTGNMYLQQAIANGNNMPAKNVNRGNYWDDIKGAFNNVVSDLSPTSAAVNIAKQYENNGTPTIAKTIGNQALKTAGDMSDLTLQGLNLVPQLAGNIVQSTYRPGYTLNDALSMNKSGAPWYEDLTSQIVGTAGLGAVEKGIGLGAGIVEQGISGVENLGSKISKDLSGYADRLNKLNAIRNELPNNSYSWFDSKYFKDWAKDPEYTNNMVNRLIKQRNTYLTANRFDGTGRAIVKGSTPYEELNKNDIPPPSEWFTNTRNTGVGENYHGSSNYLNYKYNTNSINDASRFGNWVAFMKKKGIDLSHNDILERFRANNPYDINTALGDDFNKIPNSDKDIIGKYINKDDKHKSFNESKGLGHPLFFSKEPTQVSEMLGNPFKVNLYPDDVPRKVIKGVSQGRYGGDINNLNNNNMRVRISRQYDDGGQMQGMQDNPQFLTAQSQGGQAQQMSSDGMAFSGPSHENGGIQLPNAEAEVEGGETMKNNFIFSKKLGFATIHKKIMKAKGIMEGKAMTPGTINGIKLMDSKEQELAMQQEMLKKMLNLKR